MFTDPASAQDALTFAGRASRLSDPEVRLQASGGTLAMTAAVLAPRGVLDGAPTVLGMRAVRLDPEIACDLVVAAAGLRLADDDTCAVELPPTAVTAGWAGMSPPRRGWDQTGEVDAATLASRAQWGIAAVAHAMPDAPGEDAVQTVRAAIWGELDDDLPALVRGVAFAAFTLGFIAGEERARIFQAGPWTRISLQRGHVLTRTAGTRLGLTPVRTAGR